MTILDRVHDRETWAGAPSLPRPTLDPAERLRLTVEARRTAVRAAAEYIASGRSGGRALLDYAETVETWILRDNEAAQDAPAATAGHAVPQDVSVALRRVFTAADSETAVPSSLRWALDALFEVIERHDPRRKP